jgi:pantoate--beta-alanine ligase
MVIFKNADQVSDFLSGLKKKDKNLGFVPTMGALHKGHVSLIQTSKEENDVTVCSIFINPAQFNNPEDFRRYPVTVEKDIELLIQSGCDVLFLPSVEQVYPPGYKKKIYPLGNIETMLEGYYRPGHFQGVCEVMDRLLEIIQPQRLYLGQKDYQQCMVIRKLIELSGKQQQIELVVEATIREEDGLAMSSRNLRLSKEDRAKAPVINKTLSYIKNNLGQIPLKTLRNTARTRLESEGFIVDYVEIADAYTLETVRGQSEKIVALVAASINNVRLIDNMILN